MAFGPATVDWTGIARGKGVIAVDGRIGHVVVDELSVSHLHMCVERLERLIRSDDIGDCSGVGQMRPVVCQSWSRHSVRVIRWKKSDVTRVGLSPIWVVQVVARAIDGPVLVSGRVVTLESPSLAGAVTRITTGVSVAVASHVLVSDRDRRQECRRLVFTQTFAAIVSDSSQ